MKKIALVILLALPLAGCNPGQFANKVLEGIEDVTDAIQVGVGYARSVADKYCLEVSVALQQANQLTGQAGASCKVKNEVQRIASGVASYCNGAEPVNLTTFLAKLKKAKTDARAVVAAGC